MPGDGPGLRRLQPADPDADHHGLVDPGAALLAATAIPAGGWPAAVGAFVVTGLLLALLALVRPLARLVAAIPDELAAAMLAGVLLVLCVAPFRALAADPAVIAPVVLAWLVGFVLIRRWAVPIAIPVVGSPASRAGRPTCCAER